MTKYVLVDNTQTIIWGPDKVNPEWVVNGALIVPDTFNKSKSPEWYQWTEEITPGGTYDNLTQRLSEPTLSFDSGTKTVLASYTAEDLPVIDAARNKMLAVNQYREVIIDSGFSWNDILVDSDTVGRGNLTAAVVGCLLSGALQTSPNEVFTVWRTKRNTNVPLTAAQVATLGLSMMQWYSMMIIRSGELKDQIIASTTSAEIRSIDITVGWPPHN
jgi:hypothetical protein